MARILQINDPHFSEVPPSSRTATYCLDVLNKFEWALKFAVHQQVDDIICTGDWFHSKLAHRTPHWLVNKLLTMLREILCRPEHPYVLSIPGNHDFPPGFGDLNRQPYQTLVAADLVKDIADNPIIATDGTVIVGCAYKDENAFAHIMNVAAKHKPTVLVLHQQIEAPGCSQPFDFLPAEKLAGAAPFILYGHVHVVHGTYQVGDTIFCNPSNISRGSIAEADVLRIPQVALIDTSTRQVECVAIPHRPAAEVFLLDKVERRKTISMDIAAFVENIEQTQFVALSHEVVRDRLAAIEDVDVRDECLNIWDNVG